MRRLRVGSIGSISAWLPSRRSTEHHSGALSMIRFGPRAVGEHERDLRAVLAERHRSSRWRGIGGMSWLLGVEK